MRMHSDQACRTVAAGRCKPVARGFTLGHKRSMASVSVTTEPALVEPQTKTKAKREPAPRTSTRFNRRRELILDAATVLMNERGIKGMTFVEVAQMVDLNTTGVTYYFRFKEQLAAAVFEHTLGRLERLVRAAGAKPDPRARVSALLGEMFDLHGRVLRNEERPLAILSDIRALEEPAASELLAHYQEIFRLIRAFFGEPRDEAHKIRLTARTHMLMEVIFWLTSWVGDHSINDFDRVRARLFDILDRGLALPGVAWAPARIDVPDDEQAMDSSRASLLRAATKLINRYGYRGTSVERIVAELKVTKGSFYHHLDAKDDLVLECFRRSFCRIATAVRGAEDAGGDQWQQLSSSIAMLLEVQFFDEWPLLRSTALHALPSDLHHAMLDRSNRIALRFAGMLLDGMVEGSIRMVDPMIASRVLMAMLNAAFDIRKWASSQSREEAVAIYASTFVTGLFDD